MYKGKKVGVVVPAYNEELFIREVVETMPGFVDRIIVCNDASTDATARILAGIADSRLIVINHETRRGAGGAMLSGYKHACAADLDIVAIMAGDGQMDPALLDKILDPVAGGIADYAKGDRLGRRTDSRGMPFERLFGNTVLTYVIKVASGYWHLRDPLNGYTAVTREALDRLDLDKVESGYAFETDLLVKLNACSARAINVPMPARYRNEKSKISYLKFMPQLSWVILRDYVWRLWVKYLRARRRAAHYQAPVFRQAPHRPAAEATIAQGKGEKQW